MVVIEQTCPKATSITGIAHASLVSTAEGPLYLSVWRQTLAPGAYSPPHQHDGDEAALCLDGRVRRFGAESTVALLKGLPRQIFNAAGQLPLKILTVLLSTPAAT